MCGALQIICLLTLIRALGAVEFAQRADLFAREFSWTNASIGTTSLGQQASSAQHDRRVVSLMRRDSRSASHASELIRHENGASDSREEFVGKPAGVSIAGRDCQGQENGAGYKIRSADSDTLTTVECRDGWVVFQQRTTASDFNKGWKEYQSGFRDGENLWLGLESLSKLTAAAGKLKVVLTDAGGSQKTAEYSTFQVNPSEDAYRLSVAGYSGTLGDSLSFHNGQKFSTKDSDNDQWTGGSCANHSAGAWWYKSCDQSNLNGMYATPGEQEIFGKGICWTSWHGCSYSMQKSVMMLKASSNRRRDATTKCADGYKKNELHCEIKK